MRKNEPLREDIRAAPVPLDRANTGAFIMCNPLQRIAAGRFVRAAAYAALGIAAVAPGFAQAASERVLHAFVGPDGVYPYNRLTKIGRDLYSTTYDGGSYGGARYSRSRRTAPNAPYTPSALVTMGNSS